MGLEIGVVITIKADGVRLVARLGPTIVNTAGAAQVEAKLDAVTMETAAPVELFSRLELMVLDADALAHKGTIKLSPALFHLRPSSAFVCRRHMCSPVSLWQTLGKSMEQGRRILRRNGDLLEIGPLVFVGRIVGEDLEIRFDALVLAVGTVKI